MELTFGVKYKDDTKYYKEKLNFNVTLKDLVSRFLKEFGLIVDERDYCLIVYMKGVDPYYLHSEDIHKLPQKFNLILCLNKTKEVQHVSELLESQPLEALEIVAERLVIKYFAAEFFEQRVHEQLISYNKSFLLNEKYAVAALKVLSTLILYTAKNQSHDPCGCSVYLSSMYFNEDVKNQIIRYLLTTENEEGINYALKVLISCFEDDTYFKQLDFTFINKTFERQRFAQNLSLQLKTSICTSLVHLLNFRCSTVTNEKDVMDVFNNYFDGDKMRIFQNIDIITRCFYQLESNDVLQRIFRTLTNEELNLRDELTILQGHLFRPIQWEFEETQIFKGPTTKEMDLLMSIKDNATETEIIRKMGLNMDWSCLKVGRFTINCMYCTTQNYFEEMAEIYKDVCTYTDFTFVQICNSVILVLGDILDLTKDIKKNKYLPMFYNCCNMIYPHFSKYFFYDLFFITLKTFSKLLQDNQTNDLELLKRLFSNIVMKVLDYYPNTTKKLQKWLEIVYFQEKKKEDQIDQSKLCSVVQDNIIEELKKEYSKLVMQKRIMKLQGKEFYFNLSSRSNCRYKLQFNNDGNVIFARDVTNPNSIEEFWYVSNIISVVESKVQNNFCFTLKIYENDDSSDLKTITFATPKEHEQKIWFEGIKCLLNEIPNTNHFNVEVLQLVTIELKIRQLFLNNEFVPAQAPEIPVLPENYDFPD